VPTSSAPIPPRSTMADTVLSHVTSQNRPFNAQNVADALGKHGIKKGAAQKYLEQLVDAGKIAVKDAGKQKVFFALQDGDVLSAEETKAMEFEIKEKTSELSEAKQALAQKHAALRQLGKTLTVEQMRLKTDFLAKQSGKGLSHSTEVLHTSNVLTTGNSYQSSRLLQIHQKCTVCSYKLRTLRETDTFGVKNARRA
jgi:predicted transcriptional regulator